MVIQCESCQTEFNLDESLLKKEGTKVRCSRCRHVFKAYPSAPTLPEEANESADVVEDAVPVDSAEKADALIAETKKGFGEEENERPEAELESDLDLIYQDVFSEDETRSHGEDIEPEEKVDDLFQETSPVEEVLAKGPAPIFPGMDEMEENPPGVKQEKETQPELRSEAPVKKKSSKRAMTILIPLLFIVLAVGAAYYVWQANLIPPSVLSILNASSDKQAPADSGARLLQFGSVNGAFVDTKSNGPLFVIRGMITNKYPQNRRYLKIKGSILDKKGVVVLSKTAYAGNIFSEDELKTLSLNEILKAANNRDGMAKQNLKVASGATIPFMIVFGKLPNDLSEFTVEAVSSSPGS